MSFSVGVSAGSMDMLAVAVFGYYLGSGSGGLECFGIRRVETMRHRQRSRFSYGYVIG